MSNLSLDAIRIVKIVKASGSFSTAADILHKTPSAISYRVAAIEKRLGIKLFNRNGPIVTLTKEGARLADEGEWIINAVEMLEQSMCIRSANRSVFRVAVCEFFPQAMLESFITEFVQSFPSIKLSVHKMSGAPDWDMLQGDNTDLIISTQPRPASMRAATHLLGSYPIIYCASKDYYEENYVSGKKNTSIIVGENFVDLLAKDNNVIGGDNHNLIVPDLATQIKLVRQGLGVGLLSAAAVETELKEGSLVTVDMESNLGEESLWFTWNPAKNHKFISGWCNKFCDTWPQYQRGTTSSLVLQ